MLRNLILVENVSCEGGLMSAEDLCDCTARGAAIEVPVPAKDLIAVVSLPRSSSATFSPAQLRQRSVSSDSSPSPRDALHICPPSLFVRALTTPHCPHGLARDAALLLPLVLVLRTPSEHSFRRIRRALRTGVSWRAGRRIGDEGLRKLLLTFFFTEYV
jgi:hypothetical protein